MYCFSKALHRQFLSLPPLAANKISVHSPGTLPPVSCSADASHMCSVRDPRFPRLVSPRGCFTAEFSISLSPLGLLRFLHKHLSSFCLETAELTVTSGLQRAWNLCLLYEAFTQLHAPRCAASRLRFVSPEAPGFVPSDQLVSSFVGRGGQVSVERIEEGARILTVS